MRYICNLIIIVKIYIILIDISDDNIDCNNDDNIDYDNKILTDNIDFNNNDDEKHNNIKIKSYCTCKSGARTVDTCSDVIDALYYIYSKVNNIELPTYNLKSSNLQDYI